MLGHSRYEAYAQGGHGWEHLTRHLPPCGPATCHHVDFIHMDTADIIHTVTVGDSTSPEDITDTAAAAAEVVSREDITVTAGNFVFIHMVAWTKVGGTTIAVADITYFAAAAVVVMATMVVALVIMVDIMLIEGGLMITAEVASAAMAGSIIGMVVMDSGIGATILIRSSIATPTLKSMRPLEPSLKSVRLMEPTLKLVRLLERFHQMPLNSNPSRA
ncbi:hypothetical protein RHMOL_Rhmol09G0077800 [Rhododendron molle]|uniref:Uncharacterized protein n=1 Tax=Rhododendron molle TaxID=49168 RepID=A0ACC0MAR5_RHOML|nr:hypothetical protein RHMOL_Rhmol09G0077800 [Rhododendron molle]